MSSAFVRLSRTRRFSFLVGCGCFWVVLGACAAALHAADARPVSVQDLCLMLRSGYSDADVLQATATRPLLEPLGSTAEQALRAAGADQRLIDALKTERHAVSPADAQAIRQRQAEEQRAAANATQQAALVRSQQVALVRSQPVSMPAAVPGSSAAQQPALDPHTLENLLRGKLVVFRDEKVEPADGNPLGARR